MSYDIKTLSQVGITNTIEEGDYLLISQGGYLNKLPIVDGGAFTPPSPPSPTTNVPVVPVTIYSGGSEYGMSLWDPQTGKVTYVSFAVLTFPYETDCAILDNIDSYGGYAIIGNIPLGSLYAQDNNGVSGNLDGWTIWFSGATTLPEYITIESR